ncbi:MAG: murein biosynthesis integral membrane protein MurJ [Deltaproteobacteria bacterium]|nr:murein biosynthesis integral membrane protein MurJ [Deltaproteobacteria bacterium]
MSRVAEERARGTVAERAGIVAAFTLMSRVLGYTRDAVLAHLFGAGAVFDAFVVAQTIPNLLRRLVAEGALIVTFVPLLAEARAGGGLAGMRRFTAAVLGLLLPLLLVLTGLGMAFPRVLVDFFAPGFEAESAMLAADLTRVMMPFVLFVSLMALAGGALNVQGSFAPAAAAPILLNIAVIASAVLLRDRFAQPITAVAWGVAAGGVLQLALQLPFLLKVKMLVRPIWAPGDAAVRALGARVAPAVFGVAVYQINVLVIRQIGSFLPAGQLSCYYNATRLQEFALGVFAVSVSVAALPTLSEHAARRDYDALLTTFRRALRATSFVTVPATIVVMALAAPMVHVLFRHGHYTLEAAGLTATLLIWLGLALVPIGAVRVAVPTFYALGDTRTPVIGALASLATTFAVGFLLGRRFEIHGLTLATSVASVVQLFVLWRSLRTTLARRRAELAAQGAARAPAAPAPEPVLRHALRCALASLPGAILSLALAALWPWERGSNLVGAAILLPLLLLNGLAYFAIARRLGIEEADLILKAVARRLGRAAPEGPSL